MRAQRGAARLIHTVFLMLACMDLRIGSAADVSTFIAEGDRHYEQRAEGAVEAVAKPAEIDAAIAQYRVALSLEPASIEARWKLLRALHFRGAYCGAEGEQQKRLFGEARPIGDEGIERLERLAAGKTGMARIAALKAEPQAAPLYLWTAAIWGEWALAYGKLAALREGAAEKVRDLGQSVIDLDPVLDGGGGYRVLGRLHHQCPRVVFFTTWVSKQEALNNLRKALGVAPDSKVNQLFLAEALLDEAPASRSEALELLRTSAYAPARPEWLIEDRHYAILAQSRLFGHGER